MVVVGGVTNDIRANVEASPRNLAEILMSLLPPHHHLLFNANQMRLHHNKKLPRISFRLQKIAEKKNLLVLLSMNFTLA